MDCLKGITLFFLATLFPVMVYAQNDASHQIEIGIPEVALIGIASENSASISFVPFSATEAGSTVVLQESKKDNSMWLNYTSIKKDKSSSRKVMAVVQGEMANGIKLKVKPKIKPQTGGGDVGEAEKTISLSNKPTEIITGIGSCYTGKGVNNGFNLVYELEVDESELELEKLNKQEYTFNVLYTLTD